jgi:hypothetical protein
MAEKSLDALSLVAPGLQTGLALYQGIKAAQFANKKRPNYTTPTAITDNVNLAKNAYGASTMYGLPGEGKILNRLGKSQANSINAINQSQQSPAAQLAGISSVDANSKNAIAGLGVDAAKFRFGNMNATRGQLMGANNILAGYKDKEFKYNQDDPYQASMAAASALRSGAINNAFSGLTSAAPVVAGMVGAKTTPTSGTTKIGADGLPLANVATGESPTTLANQGIISGEVNQFPNLYGDATFASLRNKYPYSLMSDADFYKAMADAQAGPINTNPSMLSTGYGR